MALPKHRLTAIIFTDIAGYTSLMGENESEAMDILKKNREIHLRSFARFNCLFHKQMGDGFMAVFSSLSEAIYASAHIIEDTVKSKIMVRIGVHEGEVIFRDNDFYGNGVNIASRIEQASKPGSIYASESVKRNLGNKKGISAIFIREAILKNVKDPIKIFEIKVDSAYLPESLQDNKGFTRVIKESWWKSVAIILAVVGLIYFFYSRVPVQNADPSYGKYTDIHLPGNSIAVLPFKYHGGNPEYEYLGAGFADGILTKLSWLKDFIIINRSSSFKFTDSQKTITEIADQLSAKMILEGSYQVANDMIRINVKLVEVRADRILLAETYGGNLEDIFKLQDLVSEGLYRILGKSEINRSAAELRSDNPVSLQAFKYYQEGISLLKENYLYRSTILDSRNFLHAALKEDPQYIEPLIGMAESFLSEIFFGYSSIYFVKDSIEKYVAKADRINP